MVLLRTGIHIYVSVPAALLSPTVVEYANVKGGRIIKESAKTWPK